VSQSKGKEQSRITGSKEGKIGKEVKGREGKESNEGNSNTAAGKKASNNKVEEGGTSNEGKEWLVARGNLIQLKLCRAKLSVLEGMSV
jgi:hypothetical protein